MTNENYNKQTTAFFTDLDENIISFDLWDDETDGDMTTFYFNNPVTGSADTVSFFEDYDTHPIIYLPNYKAMRRHIRVGICDQIEISDLNELYDFILINEA